MDPRLGEAVWKGWRQRAEGYKKDARRTDADLAAEVSELLHRDVSRATVNHWFRGRRDPSIVEFMALCEALGADVGHILLNARMTYQHVTSTPTASHALHSQARTPEYLKKNAKRLRHARQTKPKVRA